MINFNKNNNVYIYKNMTEKQPYKAIVYTVDMAWHFASFRTLQQFKYFIQNLNIKLIYKETLHKNSEYELKCYKTNYLLKNDVVSFWQTPKLTKNYTKIKALSNGSIVDCYIKTDNRSKVKTILRPNPNAKKIYKPLSVEDHIKYTSIFGTF